MLVLLQIYIGSSRATVHQNQDVLKELEVGMMVAMKVDNFPKLGRVTGVPTNATLQSTIDVIWYRQQKASHKPRWLRFFKPSEVSGKLKIGEIVLYDFTLTNKGALKKKSREYLKKICIVNS